MKKEKYKTYGRNCQCSCHIIKEKKLFSEKAVKKHYCCSYSYGLGKYKGIRNIK